MRNFYLLLANENFLKGVKKQGQTCPLDTPKRMIERRERQGEREKEREKEKERRREREKGRRRDIEKEGEIRERER